MVTLTFQPEYIGLLITDLKKQIRALENEKQHREFLCSQHFARIGDLQQELIEKTVALSHVKGSAKSTNPSGNVILTF